jgi:hypothetical protein
MRTIHALGIAPAVALAAMLAACGDDNPAGPSPGVLRVDINGPSSIAPGQTASYSVIEYRSDGTSRAPASVAWSSSNPAVVQITQEGLATAQSQTGEAIISVKAANRASKEVLVLPANTFRLVGVVTDADETTVVVPGAKVEVTGGPFTTTNDLGQFRLYGVPPEAEIRVTRDGYRPVEERVQLTTHAARNFRIGVDGSARDFSGTYTLVVTALSPCSSGARPLKPELQQRSYQATIDQSSARLTVRLDENRFPPHPGMPTNRFTGYVTPTGAEFTMGATSYYYYDAEPAANITELLPDGSRLLIHGSVTTTGSPAGLSGPFTGWFSHYSSWTLLGNCQAATFTLTRR